MRSNQTGSSSKSNPIRSPRALWSVWAAFVAVVGGVETGGLGTGASPDGWRGAWGSRSVACGQCASGFGSKLESGGVMSASTSVSADFDGDGRIDIAVRTLFNAAAAGVYMLWGTGDGHFEPAQLLWAGPTVALAVGDVRIGGLPDLVVSTNGPVQIFTLANTGGRQFAAMTPISFTPPSTCSDLAVGDVNGDGFQDVIGLDRNNDRVGVFAGNGNGTFAPPVSTTIAMTSASALDSVAAGDLNGDGRADCVVVDRFTSGGQARVHTMIGGAGPLVLNATQTFALTPGPVGLGDLDGDGRLDAILNLGGSVQRIAFFRGLGDGTMAPAVLSPSGSQTLGRPVIRDLDLDGDADVAMGNNVIRLWLNDGAGGLTLQPALPSNAGGFSVQAGSFFGTGRPDLAIVGSGVSQPIVTTFPSVTLPSVVHAVQLVVPACPGQTVFPEVTADPDLDARYVWEVRRGRLGYFPLVDGEEIFPDASEPVAFARDVNAAQVAITMADRCCMVDTFFTVRCVVTTACGVTAGPDILITLCRVDMTCDGFVDFFDYDQFVQSYIDGDSTADFNRDGFLDFFDYDDFVTAFELGC